MSRIARFTGELMPDGAMLLAQGANRVCRALNVKRTRAVPEQFEQTHGQAEPITYEIRMRFTVPEETVLDIESIELHES